MKLIKSCPIWLDNSPIPDTKPKFFIYKSLGFFSFIHLFVLALALTNQLTKNAKAMIKLQRLLLRKAGMFITDYMSPVLKTTQSIDKAN